MNQKAIVLMTLGLLMAVSFARVDANPNGQIPPLPQAFYGDLSGFHSPLSLG